MSEVRSAIIEARVQSQFGFARYLDLDKKRGKANNDEDEDENGGGERKKGQNRRRC